MKAPTISSLCVSPELGNAAENILNDGETLSGFVDASVKANIKCRVLQKEFIKRGLQARNEAQTSHEYYSKEQVLAELNEMLSKAKAK